MGSFDRIQGFTVALLIKCTALLKERFFFLENGKKTTPGECVIEY